jgi:hypothetical protein
LLEKASETIRIHWHLGQRDFLDEMGAELVTLARRALQGVPLTFVFDRPRRAVSLAEGLDRQHPCVLLAVGLHLPHLAEQAGARTDPKAFIQKLVSLSRLALSAAIQKRNFLRGHSHKLPELNRAFMLERARLLVVPVGLETVARTIIGSGQIHAPAALEFACQIIRTLKETLHQDGQSFLLATVIDPSATTRIGDDRQQIEESSSLHAERRGMETHESASRTVAGLTTGDSALPVKKQLQAIGSIHAITESGSGTLLSSESAPPTPEEAVELVRYAWQHTEIARLRFQRGLSSQRQESATWLMTE